MFGIGDESRIAIQLLQKNITKLEQQVKELKIENKEELSKKFYCGVFVGAITLAIVLILFK